MKKSFKDTKFISWLLSPKSDFILFVILLVLLNLVGQSLSLRIDLTEQKSYSLSKASKQLVKTIEEPISIRVFFSENLPSPYNSVEQYLKDLLEEYGRAANKNFKYTFMDMSKLENQKIAGGFGLRQIQIQEVKDSEVGFKQAYMGLAISYGDNVEIIDSITSESGLEYKLTNQISKMIATSSILTGLTENVQLKLFLSQDLAKFNINGFDTIDESVQEAYKAVNKKNKNRIEFQQFSPAGSEASIIADKYGLQKITWTDDADKNNIINGVSVIGLVLEYEDTFRLIDLQMARSIFGYGISGLDNLEVNITSGLQSLVSKSVQVGYITGHGEPSIFDSESGAGVLNDLISDWYEVQEINLDETDIPVNVTSIIINGAQSRIPDTELYKIDQFLMRGGNIIVFDDPFIERQSEQQSYYYSAPPEYLPNDTGLDEMLSKYGVSVDTSYVMDKSCMVQNNQNYGTLNYYFVPISTQKELAPKNPITQNLSHVLFLQAGPVNITLDENQKDREAIVLASSSKESWLVKEDIILNPLYITPPAEDTMGMNNLAVLLDGNFESYFSSKPEDIFAEEEEIPADSSITDTNHLSKSVLKGKVLVIGTSKVTYSNVIEAAGSQPISVFLRNSIDYINGNSDLCTMRTKGLSWNMLDKVTPTSASIAKMINQYILPLLVVICGLLIWRVRSVKRRQIRKEWSHDEREKDIGGKNEN